jgi:hypothetical protein
MLTLDQVVVKTPDTVSRIIEKEAVIILPAHGQVKVINEVGARLWEMADGTRTIADMVDILCEEYAVIREQAEEDALEFIQRMIEKKMFVVMG